MGTLWFAIIFQAAVIVHLTYVVPYLPRTFTQRLTTLSCPVISCRLAIARSTLPAHRLQLCFILAILIVFAVNGVEYIYQGQARARERLGYAGALKAVGAGWLMLAIVDVSQAVRRMSTSISYFPSASTDPLALMVEFRRRYVPPPNHLQLYHDFCACTCNGRRTPTVH